jgi:hypothetical protein
LLLSKKNNSFANLGLGSKTFLKRILGLFRKAFLEYFRTYLFDQCFLDTASTSRHKFGVLYEENNITKLNLQVRIAKSISFIRIYMKYIPKKLSVRNEHGEEVEYSDAEFLVLLI